MEILTRFQSENRSYSRKLLQAESRYFVIWLIAIFCSMLLPVKAVGSVSQEDGEIGGEIFGGGGGYFHPFIKVSENYSDNIHYDPSHGKSDFFTILSPGLLLMAPGSKIDDPGANILSIATPGGVLISKDEDAQESRFQGRLLYNADIEDYYRYDENDVNTANLEGGFQCNLKGGLSIDLIHQRSTSYKARSESVREEISRYVVHLTSGVLHYRFSEKTDFRVAYRLFDVEYDAVLDRISDRQDRVMSGGFFYTLTQKSSLYAIYEYFDNNYNGINFKNSVEYHYSGGFRWRMSEKTYGRIALGYGIKAFEEQMVDDSRSLIVQASLSNQLTDKTSLQLMVLRRSNEADTEDGRYLYTNRILASYLFRMNEAVTVGLKLSYTEDQYKEASAGAPKEKSVGIYPKVGYAFRKWLTFGCLYGFEKRESDREGMGYVQNGYSMEIQAIF